MAAVDKSLIVFRQRLGGGDIGLDHEFFDKFVGIKALTQDHGFNLTGFSENNAPFRYIKAQGIAFFLGLEQGLKRLPQGLEHRFKPFAGGFAVTGILGLLV